MWLRHISGPRARTPLLLVALMTALTGPALAADRVRTWSLQDLDGGDTGDLIARTLNSMSGVHGAKFDLYRCELVLTLGDNITDLQVTKILQNSQGWRAVPGAGKGRYLPQTEYPKGADVALLTKDGAAVGPLDKLRVPGKITIFDAYADWCIACRPMDERIRAFVKGRPDVAVRKLNVARWDSPLAKEFGSRLTALPHLVVFTPDGKRHEFDGNTWEQVAKAMRWK
jgi:thiol-disulfide isomerase/thioredoxin